MRTAIKLILAALLLVGAIVLVGRCRDSRAREKATAGQVKLEVADSVVRDRTDSVAVTEQPHTRTEHALEEVLHRPRIAPPKVSTGRTIAADTAVSRDTTQYVTKAHDDSVQHRLDSTTVAAQKYHDAAEDVIAAQKRLIVAQMNARVAAQNVIEHPKPSSRWSIGGHAGYGETLYQGKIVQGPQAGVSVHYRFF